MDVQPIVKEILDSRKEKGGIKRVYFVACGGSYAGFYPAFYLIEHESPNLVTGIYTSNEFVHALPKGVDQNSIVVLCSMRGTPETTEAAKAARNAGAATVALYVQESELTTVSEYAIQYESIALDESKVENVNSSIGLMFAFELLYQLEGYSHYADAVQGMKIIDKIYRQAYEYALPKAEIFAEQCKDDKVIYVIGGGPSMGSAYIFSICNLMEMQWIHSPTVNSGELLHGPFEAVDKNLAIVVLMSEGRTRPVDERSLKFLKNYGERLFLLDAKELGLNQINDSVVEYFNHLIFSSILNNVYLRKLSDAKQHPWTNRRYMWKVEY